MVRVWDARAGVLLAGPLSAGDGPGFGSVIGLSDVSPDGTMIASHSFTGALRVWALPSGQPVARLDVPPAPSIVGTVFVDNDNIIYAAGDLHRYNIRTNVRTDLVQEKPIAGILSANPKHTAVAVSGGPANPGPEITIVALDERQLGASRSIALPPGFAPARADNLDRLSVDATGTQLLAFDTQAHLYDLTTPTPNWRVVDLPGDGTLQRASFTRDGRYVVTLHVNLLQNRATASLLDPGTLRTIASVRLPANTIEFRFSPDYRLLASTYIDRGQTKSVVLIHDVATGALMKTLTDFNTVGGSGLVVALDLSFSADSKQLAAGTLTGDGLVWDVDSWATTRIQSARYLEFDRLGRYLVTVSPTSLVTLLEGRTLTIPQGLAPITGRIAARPLSHPTEPLLLTDGTCGGFVNSLGLRDVVLYDTQSGREIGIGLPLNCGFWFPDGKSFLGKDETSIQIWSADPDEWAKSACHFAGRDLTAAEWERYGPQKPYRKTCSD
jgi:WD40 repeat protein